MLPLLITSFIQIRLFDIVDILLVAFLMYELYNLLKGTAAINIFFGILAVFLTWKLVKALEMELLTEILGAFISVGFIALIVVFQPEIRRFLLLLGTTTISSSNKRFLFWRFSMNKQHSLDIDQLIAACRELAATKTGALIVLARKNELKQLASNGEKIDARISSALLENIFYKNSPLHDGAVIIGKNRIDAARVVLPVTSKTDFPAEYGLRHRAAMGVSEQTDAVALIVSEQTGRLAYCADATLHTHVSAEELHQVLNQLFATKK